MFVRRKNSHFSAGLSASPPIRQTETNKRATKADSDEQHVPHLAAEPSIPQIFAFHHKAKKT